VTRCAGSSRRSRAASTRTPKSSRRSFRIPGFYDAVARITDSAIALAAMLDAKAGGLRPDFERLHPPS